MALTGYTRECKRRSGGVLTIGIIEKKNILTETVDAQNPGAYSAITMESGESFKKYEFKEDVASFTETVTGEGGNISVASNVLFDFGAMDIDSRNAVEEIMDASPCGLIAAIKKLDGQVVIVGVTPSEGKERPLRITSSEGTTGAAVTDSPSENVTLSRTGIEKAMYYTGDFDALFTAA